MYLHLGNDVVVKSSEIIGIFDIDNTTISKNTRDFLALAQKENKVVNVSMELPRSFIVCGDKDNETVYISQLSPSTLLRRASSVVPIND